MTKFKAEQVERHIRKNHPGCPDFAVVYFVNEIGKRDWTKKTRLGGAVGIMMQSTIRHIMTDYDQLLLCGVDRLEARRRVQPRVNALIESWGERKINARVSDKASK